MARDDVGVIIQNDEVYIHAADLVDWLNQCAEVAAIHLDDQAADAFDLAQSEISELIAEKLQ